VRNVATLFTPRSQPVKLTATWIICSSNTLSHLHLHQTTRINDKKTSGYFKLKAKEE